MARRSRSILRNAPLGYTCGLPRSRWNPEIRCATTWWNLSLGEVTALLTSKQSYRRTERGAEGVEETARPDDLEQQIASRTEAFVRDIIALIRR